MTGLAPGRGPRIDELDVGGVSHPGVPRTDNRDRVLMGQISTRVEVLHANLTRGQTVVPELVDLGAMRRDAAARFRAGLLAVGDDGPRTDCLLA